MLRVELKHLFMCHVLKRNATVPSTRAPLVFEDRRIHAVQLSVFAQTPLVADRRRAVHPLCRTQTVVDHPDADHFGLGHAVDVFHRPSVDGQRQSLPSQLPGRSLTAIN